MNIQTLWEGQKFPNCDTCKKECGKYTYDNLCSNLNYLKNYGQEYYERMEESFRELQKLTQDRLSIYSFGCGCCLDYIAGTQVFGSKFTYFNIDECEWEIKQTDNYKNLVANMPKSNLNFDEGVKLLTVAVKNVVICFFNSLNDILNNRKNLKKEFIEALKGKTNFYIVCNYTRGGNHTLAWNEECFLNDLCKELKNDYKIKQLTILNGEGIIITGVR